MRALLLLPLLWGALVSHGTPVTYPNAPGASESPVFVEHWGPESSARQVDPQAARVVGSRNSDVYHRPSCHHARRIHDENLVSFPSEAAAREAGRRACRTCRPG